MHWAVFVGAIVAFVAAALCASVVAFWLLAVVLRLLGLLP